MSDKSGDKSREQSSRKTAGASRKARLAAALKANLARRKVQLRERALARSRSAAASEES